MKKLLLGVFLLSFAACGPATRISGTWIAPEIRSGGYRSIFITAIMEEVLKREYMEVEMQKVLKDKGVRSSTSLGVIRPGFMASREVDRNEVKEIISKSGYDAIMTIILIDATTEARFIPGNMMMHDPWMMGPMGMRGNMWGHHAMMSPMMMSPGHYTFDRNYFIEINVYDADSELLVWSAQSQTTNPNSLERFATGFAHAVANRMLKDNVITRSSRSVSNNSGESW